jgi:hypothetical protein
MPHPLPRPRLTHRRIKKGANPAFRTLTSGPPHSRDLVFQDLSLVLFPGMRLSCLAHAWAWRAALRAHRDEQAAVLLRARSGAKRAALRAHRDEQAAVLLRARSGAKRAALRAHRTGREACGAGQGLRSLMRGEANES